MTRIKELPKQLVLMVFLIVVVLGYGYFKNRSPASSSPADPTPALSEAIPPIDPPPHVDMPLLFLEDSVETYPYSPDSYPAYAEAHPDAPCATWENGGLVWEYYVFQRPAQPSWVAVVGQPEFRFCGFPRPIPAKPPKPTPIPIVPDPSPESTSSP